MKPTEFTSAVKPIVLANKNFNKIFCIGYNKTGTTTLETVLRLYGYSLPNQQEQEIKLTKNCFKTDYLELQSFCSKFDAFQDMPFSQGLTFVVADALFPNSKFILTERDPDEWFRSIEAFHRKVMKINGNKKITKNDIFTKFNYLYEGYIHDNHERLLSNFVGTEKTVLWDKLYDKDHYIQIYSHRNKEIKRYFSNTPHKILIIDPTKERNTEKICNFLNIPSKFSIPMPHANKT